MKHYTVKNAPIEVSLEKEYNESMNTPLPGILTLRREKLTFTQTMAVPRSYRHNPHVFEGHFITCTVNDRGTVRITPRKDFHMLVKHRLEVELEVSRALDALEEL